MRYLILALVLVFAGCSQRLLVKDCQKLEGVELYNCEFVKRL